MNWFTTPPYVPLSDPEPTGVLHAMADADANEERRYLLERRPIGRGRTLNVSWSWTWLQWSLGIGADYSPYDTEAAAAWVGVGVGPIVVEAFVERGQS